MAIAMKSRLSTKSTAKTDFHRSSSSGRFKVEVDDLNQYSNPKSTRLSLERALKDAKTGKVRSKL